MSCHCRASSTPEAARITQRAMQQKWSQVPIVLVTCCLACSMYRTVATQGFEHPNLLCFSRHVQCGWGSTETGQANATDQNQRSQANKVVAQLAPNFVCRYCVMKCTCDARLAKALPSGLPQVVPYCITHCITYCTTTSPLFNHHLYPTDLRSIASP